jgi:ABC-2 type transport system permease protein
MFEVTAHETRWRLRGTAALAVVVSLFALLMIAFYPSIAESAADLEGYIESLPPVIREAFGIEAFASVEGFLATEFYQFAWVLLLGVYFAYRAAGLIAGDVERERMDVLLSAPISRVRVVVEKYLTLIAPLLVANVVVVAVVYGGVLAIDESISLTRLLAVHALSIPYLLLTAAIGLALSVTLQRTDLAQRGALGLVFGLFIVEAGAAAAGLDWLALIAPTHYYDPTAILVRGQYDLAGAGIMLAGAVAVVALSALWFRRVDVR